MLKPVRYELRSTWTFEAPADVVLAALRDLESYARWWPQVRVAERVGEHRVRMRCRSALPYDLVFVVEESGIDVGRGYLEGTLTGDLDGMSRWVVTGDPDGAGTTASFLEVVVTTPWAMNLLAPVARPLVLANHARMMRDGEAGLRADLDGRPAPEPARR